MLPPCSLIRAVIRRVFILWFVASVLLDETVTIRSHICIALQWRYYKVLAQSLEDFKICHSFVLVYSEIYKGDFNIRYIFINVYIYFWIKFRCTVLATEFMKCNRTALFPIKTKTISRTIPYIYSVKLLVRIARIFAKIRIEKLWYGMNGTSSSLYSRVEL